MGGAEYRVQHVPEVGGGQPGVAVEDAGGERVGVDDGDAADADRGESPGKVSRRRRGAAAGWVADRAGGCRGLHDAADREPDLGRERCVCRVLKLGEHLQPVLLHDRQ